MKDVLRFPINMPIRVALRPGEGKQVEGRYGPQVMYSLADDRVMYVPPLVGQRIGELAIGPGEPFEILRQEVQSGTRRWVEWRVRRVPHEPLPPPDAAPAAEVSPSDDHSNASTNGRSQARPNGHDRGEMSRLPVAISQTISAGGRAMELALSGAAEIAQRVEGCAAARSYCLRFSSEDIRAIGLTLFIQTMREAGGRWQG